MADSGPGFGFVRAGFASSQRTAFNSDNEIPHTRIPLIKDFDALLKLRVPKHELRNIVAVHQPVLGEIDRNGKRRKLAKRVRGAGRQRRGPSARLQSG